MKRTQVLVADAQPIFRVLCEGQWEEPDDDGLSPEAIRSALVGDIFGPDKKR